MGGPLGNFTNVVAAIVSILIVAAWISVELLTVLGFTVTTNSGNLFAAATAVLGYIFGSRQNQATVENGVTKASVVTTMLPVALLLSVVLTGFHF